MQIELNEITVRELTQGYVDNEENGVLGYSGRLDIRPPYQREFIYKDKQRDAVIDTISKDFPLNVMYWALREDLRLGTVGIDIKDPEILTNLKRELIAPKFKVKDNAIYVEKKEEIIKRINKSPNLADAVVYWNWMRKGYKVRGGALPLFAGQ